MTRMRRLQYGLRIRIRAGSRGARLFWVGEGDCGGSIRFGGEAVVNGVGIEMYNGTIPANVALGVEACLEKCNI